MRSSMGDGSGGKAVFPWGQEEGLQGDSGMGRAGCVVHAAVPVGLLLC